MLTQYPHWNGKVVAIMVNQHESVVGIPQCSNYTTLPILQDDLDNSLRTTMGAAYNSILIIDGQGILRHHLESARFPEAAEVIVGIVEPLLQ